MNNTNDPYPDMELAEIAVQAEQIARELDLVEGELQQPVTMVTGPEPPVAPAPTKKEEPIYLTYQQCWNCRHQLERKQMYILNTDPTPCGGIYWRDDATGVIKHVNDKKDATKFTLINARNWGAHQRQIFELIDQDMAKEINSKRCLIEGYLGVSTNAVLKKAPNNPQARARILALSGKHPPKEITTYDALKDWVEQNCGAEPKRVDGKWTLVTPQEPVTAFSLGIHFTDREVGECTYTVNREAYSEYDIPSDVIERIVTNNPLAGAEQIAALIQEWVRTDGDVWATEPDMNAVGTYEYEDHEMQDTNRHNWTFRGGLAPATAKLADYLRTILSADELRRRGI